MKAPINCPVCGDPMLNTFPPAEDLNNRVTKSCTRRLDHKITILADGDEVSQMSIDLGNGLEAIFLLLMGKIWVQPTKASKKDKNFVILPMFEPDLSNYKKLVDKVKTYLVFS